MGWHLLFSRLFYVDSENHGSLLSHRLQSRYHSPPCTRYCVRVWPWCNGAYGVIMVVVVGAPVVVVVGGTAIVVVVVGAVVVELCTCNHSS